MKKLGEYDPSALTQQMVRHQIDDELLQNAEEDVRLNRITMPSMIPEEGINSWLPFTKSAIFNGNPENFDFAPSV